MAQSLASAFAADAADIAAQIGRRALGELLAAHRLWTEWLDEGRVRKLALVAERAWHAPLAGDNEGTYSGAVRCARTSRTSWSVCVAGTTSAEGERSAPLP